MTGIVECKNSTATSPASSWLGHFGSARIIFFFHCSAFKGLGSSSLGFFPAVCPLHSSSCLCEWFPLPWEKLAQCTHASQSDLEMASLSLVWSLCPRLCFHFIMKEQGAFFWLPCLGWWTSAGAHQCGYGSILRLDWNGRTVLWLQVWLCLLNWPAAV